MILTFATTWLLVEAVLGTAILHYLQKASHQRLRRYPPHRFAKQSGTEFQGNKIPAMLIEMVAVAFH